MKQIFRLGTLGLALCMGSPVSAQFMAKRVNRSADILLHGPIDRVFPLFSPEGEKHWDPSWSYETVFSASGGVEENMVFTAIGTHHIGPATPVWIVDAYDTANFVVRYSVVSSDFIIVIHIVCAKISETTTSAHVSYTMTGLTDDGNAFVEKRITHMFSENLKNWEEPINRYLAR